VSRVFASRASSSLRSGVKSKTFLFLKNDTQKPINQDFIAGIAIGTRVPYLCGDSVTRNEMAASVKEKPKAEAKQQPNGLATVECQPVPSGGRRRRRHFHRILPQIFLRLVSVGI